MSKNLLIVYSSNSGSTETTAKIIAQNIEFCNIKVTLKKATQITAQDFKNYTHILIGSPSWKVNNKEGQPHEDIINLLQNTTPNDTKNSLFAVFGCGDKSYLQFCNAVEVIEQYLKANQAMFFNQSLKIDSFYYNLDDNIKIINSWASELLQKIK